MSYRRPMTVRSLMLAVSTGAVLTALTSVGVSAPNSLQKGPLGATGAVVPAAGEVAVTRQLVQQGRVGFVGGVLTQPSQAPVHEVAGRYLAARPDIIGHVALADLVPVRTAALARGQVVRYKQTYAGIEVLGADTVVRVDELGQVRWVSSGARAISPLVATEPVLSAREALVLVGEGAGYALPVLDAMDADQTTRLLIYAPPILTEPRLAYQVELPFDPQRLQKIRAYVDAETGTVYASENRVRRQALPMCPSESQLAYVYGDNPVETALSCQSLSNYLPANASTLANADVTVLNCIDNNGCRDIQGQQMHFCDFEARAVADASGNFTAFAFDSNTAAEDSFAEVQMFYHVNKAYEIARELGEFPNGFDNTGQQPLTAIVNFRTPSFEQTSFCSGSSYTGSEPLLPFDNALFVPAGGLFPGNPAFPPEDSIIFGQGSAGDFSYDGDVIYHEFGHAVMDAIDRDLPIIAFDQYGLNSTPGGMHEGYADLMSMFVTDDPEVGEYTAMGLGINAIRNLANTATCPDSLVGEIHDDSLPLTGAIWEARQAVATTAADKLAFDRAVFAAQHGLGSTPSTFDDFQVAAARTLVEIEATLGQAAAQVVSDIFVARGLDGCNDRVIDGSDTKQLLFSPGTDIFVVGPSQVPGPVQFSLELPGPATAISVLVERSTFESPLFGPGGATPEANIALVLKADEMPITWTALTDFVSDATDEATLEFTPVENANDIWQGTAEIVGDFPAGTYHLQLVNRGPSWVMADISFDFQLVPESGCGCQVSPRQRGSWTGAWLLCLFAAAVLLRRRCGGGA